MGIKNTTYSHNGSNCSKTTRYTDGCARTTVRDRSSGVVRSDTKHKTRNHQNW